MFVISKEEKLLFELYKAIGTPEEIHKRMASPCPEANEGYAPLPEVLREDFHVCAGVLEDDDDGEPVTREFEGSTVVKKDSWKD